MPLLGSGNGGFYTREAAELLLRTVERYEPASLEDVRVVAYSEHARTALEAVAGDIAALEADET